MSIATLGDLHELLVRFISQSEHRTAALRAALVTTVSIGVAFADGGQSVDMRIVVLNEAGSPLRHTLRPKGLRVELGAIPGAMGGSPVRTLIIVPATTSPTSPVDFSRLAVGVGQDASGPARNPVSDGLHTDPADCRFARVSTIANFDGSYRSAIVSGFVDVSSREGITLAFFDRPCHLTGTRTYHSDTTHAVVTEDADVEVSESGFVWLIRRTIEPNHFRLVRPEHAPTTPAIVISPLENRRNDAFRFRDDWLDAAIP